MFLRDHRVIAVLYISTQEIKNIAVFLRPCSLAVVFLFHAVIFSSDGGLSCFGFLNSCFDFRITCYDLLSSCLVFSEHASFLVHAVVFRLML